MPISPTVRFDEDGRPYQATVPRRVKILLKREAKEKRRTASDMIRRIMARHFDVDVRTESVGPKIDAEAERTGDRRSRIIREVLVARYEGK